MGGVDYGRSKNDYTNDRSVSALIIHNHKNTESKAKTE